MADSGVRAGDFVLDIGAGDGALTACLLSTGARVIAVEAHPGRARYLRQRFDGQRVTVVQTDAAAMKLPRQPFRVVANPPYAISSALLRVLLASGSRLVAADLVLQRAVVRQYAEGRAAGAGRWLRQWDVRAGKSLPRRAFRPVPRVDSAVLIVRRK